jgi:hypothetical protein
MVPVRSYVPVAVVQGPGVAVKPLILQRIVQSVVAVLEGSLSKEILVGIPEKLVIIRM